MKISSRSTLLVGFDPRTALAVARSLHRRKIPVVVATLAPWETPIRSRAIHAFVALPDATTSPDSFLTELLSTIHIHTVDTVIPLTDRALVALRAHDAVLRREITLLAPTPNQSKIILDKAATTRAARRLGIPVPATAELHDLKAVDVITQRLKFPLVIKSRDKSVVCQQSVLPPQDARCCATPAELNAVVSQTEHPADLLLQERVPGDDVGLALLMSGGDVLYSFQYRARRLLPAEGGVCVLARSEPVNTMFLTCAARLLRKLEWEGLAQVDFRHDPRTGRFTLLEINGRFWGSTAAATCSGADFPWYAWQLGHGETPTCHAYRTGVSVRWLEGDLRRLLHLTRSPHRGEHSIATELLSFVSAFTPSVRGMFWSWRDPLAGIDMTTLLGRTWLQTRWRNMAQRVRNRARKRTPDDLPTQTPSPEAESCIGPMVTKS